MPNYIIKIADRYFEYSEIVDAPVTEPMTREDFLNYYRRRYGELAVEHQLPARMARVEEKGTSSMEDEFWEDTVECNRAGPNESEWTPADFVRWVHESRTQRGSSE